ncbi:unnamed protein product [Didymodactylos carnosus]|uniref:Reelin domain-containing protein n=1 Tax=Didymodactylos carnosus TaxID=1234261 RepID=A0A813RAU0_9BILA|nr:unnamed protein product [Didymodactylos carnosus]CAF3562499.1 unnamed protein product [Didymodactylos carnosus]
MVSCLLFVTIVYSLPHGAPEEACKTMIPHHKQNVPQPETTSPITSFKGVWNSEKTTVTVRIESNEPIKGIFIQGRKLNTDLPIGTFETEPSMHLVDCKTARLTHNKIFKDKKSFEFKWEKPVDFGNADKIQFW